MRARWLAPSTSGLGPDYSYGRPNRRGCQAICLSKTAIWSSVFQGLVGLGARDPGRQCEFSPARKSYHPEFLHWHLQDQWSVASGRWSVRSGTTASPVPGQEQRLRRAQRRQWGGAGALKCGMRNAECGRRGRGTLTRPSQMRNGECGVRKKRQRQEAEGGCRKRWQLAQ